MSKTRVIAVAAGTLAALVLAGAPAHAGESQGRTTSEVTCAGAMLTVSGASGNGGNNWGAVQVSGGGHLVVASLEYAMYDDTAALTLDDEVLSHGGAHARQDSTECVVASEQAVLGAIVPGGFEYPTGTAPTDTITLSLKAVVVPRP